ATMLVQAEAGDVGLAAGAHATHLAAGASSTRARPGRTLLSRRSASPTTCCGPIAYCRRPHTQGRSQTSSWQTTRDTVTSPSYRAASPRKLSTLTRSLMASESHFEVEASDTLRQPGCRSAPGGGKGRSKTSDRGLGSRFTAFFGRDLLRVACCFVMASLR